MKKNILLLSIMATLLSISGCKGNTKNGDTPKITNKEKISQEKCKNKTDIKQCIELTDYYAKKNDKEKSREYLRLTCSFGTDKDCKEATKVTNLKGKELEEALFI